MLTIFGLLGQRRRAKITEIVSTRRSIRSRGPNAKNTLCSRGHPYDVVVIKKNGQIYRDCRECRRHHKAKFLARIGMTESEYGRRRRYVRRQKILAGRGLPVVPSLVPK